MDSVEPTGPNELAEHFSAKAATIISPTYEELPVKIQKPTKVDRHKNPFKAMANQIDVSQVDPETYFQAALMGMSMPDVSTFSLTTCTPLCTCSLCHTLSKSSRSFVTASSGTYDSDDERSDPNDEVMVTMLSYVEGAPASIELPMSQVLLPTLSSRKSRNAKAKAWTQASPLQESQDLEAKLQRAKDYDTKLSRKRLRLQMVRDKLKLATMIADEVPTIEVQVARLERVREWEVTDSTGGVKWFPTNDQHFSVS